LNKPPAELRMKNRIKTIHSSLEIEGNTLTIIKQDYFTRKEYLKNFREISTATASRDLNYAVENGLIEKIGDINRTRYKYK
jgi:Fic family protein